MDLTITILLNGCFPHSTTEIQYLFKNNLFILMKETSDPLLHTHKTYTQ